MIFLKCKKWNSSNINKYLCVRKNDTPYDDLPKYMLTKNHHKSIKHQKYYEIQWIKIDY